MKIENEMPVSERAAAPGKARVKWMAIGSC